MVAVMVPATPAAGVATEPWLVVAATALEYVVLAGVASDTTRFVTAAVPTLVTTIW